MESRSRPSFTVSSSPADASGALHANSSNEQLQNGSRSLENGLLRDPQNDQRDLHDHPNNAENGRKTQSAGPGPPDLQNSGFSAQTPPASVQNDLAINDTENSPSRETPGLNFKKKDVKRSRTQSFQLVLSTASLISLKQHYSNGVQRTNSTISNHNAPNAPSSSVLASKNFQSFIQAPVLSSISTVKTDGVEIGQQMPFNGDSRSDSTSSGHEGSANDEDDYTDHDTILQQQRLTLNALKKLSLSPMPISSTEDNIPKRVSRKSLSSRIDTAEKPKTEPYQPAEVDLSSFASLTRQPNMGNASLATPVAVKMDETSPQLPQKPSNGPQSPFSPQEVSGSESVLSAAAHDYHSELRQNQLNQFRPQSRVPAAVMPPQDMNVRRKPGSLAVHEPAPAAASQSSSTRHLQQIKGLRSPMYIPAVLRMTINDDEALMGAESPNQTAFPEHNSLLGHDSYTHAASTLVLDRPASRAGSLRSFDSNVSAESNSSSKFSPPVRPQSITGPFTIDRKKYEYILKTAPTRKHWLKDEAILKCQITHCPKVFNFFERRHHCRKCGGIYCKEHTLHYLYINHLAQFTTGGRGTLSKVCDNCIEEYNVFMRHEFGVDMALPTSEYKKEPARPVAFLGARMPDRNEQVVGSVPANWSWSSF